MREGKGREGFRVHGSSVCCTLNGLSFGSAREFGVMFAREGRAFCLSPFSPFLFLGLYMVLMHRRTTDI